MGGTLVMKGLLRGIENEAGMGGPARSPSDDATGIGVDDESHVDEADPGRDIGEVGDPQPIRPVRKMAIDLIERTGGRPVLRT